MGSSGAASLHHSDGAIRVIGNRWRDNWARFFSEAPKKKRTRIVMIGVIGVGGSLALTACLPMLMSLHFQQQQRPKVISRPELKGVEYVVTCNKGIHDVLEVNLYQCPSTKFDPDSCIHRDRGFGISGRCNDVVVGIKEDSIVSYQGNTMLFRYSLLKP